MRLAFPWNLSFVLFITHLALLGTTTARAQSSHPRFEQDYMLSEAPLESIRFSDSLWKPRLDTHREVMAQHCLNYLGLEGGAYDLLRKNKVERLYHTSTWGDSDIYKVLEGLLRIQRLNANEELTRKFAKKVDESIDLIAAAQEADGYLFPFVSLYKPGYKHFSDDANQMNELYSMGHFFEFAVEHYQFTGDKRALDIAEKLADCIAANYGPEEGKFKQPSGHAEVELGLIRLYRATGKKKYLDLSKYLIDLHRTIAGRCSHGKPSLGDNIPHGHVVATCYLYASAVDLAQLTGDTALMQMMEKKWEHARTKKKYIVGNYGHRGYKEGFSDDYELNHNLCYCESCSGVAYVLWTYRLFLATGDAKYTNEIERTLYNSFLSATSPEGNMFYYRNPIRTKPSMLRHAWCGISCCPTTMARFFPLVGSYAYTTNAKMNDVYVNLYAQSEATFKLGEQEISIKQTTDYPRNGRVTLDYRKAASGPAIQLRLRVPQWANDIRWTVDGKPTTPTIEKGHAVFPCKNPTGQIAFDAPMPVVRIASHPKVTFNHGQVALQRGPLVYCLEGCDNPQLAKNNDFDNAVLAKRQSFKLAKKKIGDMLEVDAIVATAMDGEPLTAIPFYAHSLRGSTLMTVWIKQLGLERPTNMDDPTWDGLLYRPLDPSTLSDNTAPLNTDYVFFSENLASGSDLPALGDGLLPKNSADDAVGRITWKPGKGNTQELLCCFYSMRTVSSCGVYWYDNGGTARVPKSWKLIGRDHKRNKDRWSPIRARGAYPTEPNKMNRIEFSPMTASAMKLIVELPEGNSGGVYEVRFK